MCMKNASVPSYPDELAAIAPLIPILFPAFERSTERACEFFEKLGKEINVDLFPELVRYYMAEELKDKGLVLENYQFEEIRKNGLCLVFNQRRIRIWKADENDLPAPGNSGVKMGFLNQQLSFSLASDGAFIAVERNLVILWNVNVHHRFARLHLVMPESAENKWSTAGAYWAEEIPNPLLSDAAKPLETEDAESTDIPGIQHPDTDAEERSGSL